MPRPGPRRIAVAVRLTADLIDELDWQANAEGLLMASGEPNRSDLIRLMIAYARENMPTGWRPEDWRPSR
ncbi:MAG: hypothetical protein HOQ24_19135 [Mycobacteriaceae bacterium]|nr:hypothetical protein [Mycobacteriaceae bacterium]